MSEQKEAWSTNNEDFRYSDLDDLLDSNDELKVGDTVYKGIAVQPKLTDLIDVDDILETIANRAYEFGDEYSEGVLDNVDADAKDELSTFLLGWMEKHLTINFYQVHNAEAVILTHEMMGAHQ